METDFFNTLGKIGDGIFTGNYLEVQIENDIVKQCERYI